MLSKSHQNYFITWQLNCFRLCMFSQFLSVHYLWTCFQFSLCQLSIVLLFYCLFLFCSCFCLFFPQFSSFFISPPPPPPTFFSGCSFRRAKFKWSVHAVCVCFQGIGSKLMSKMGYVPGQGLGVSGQGKAEPVPIMLLPQGESTSCLESPLPAIQSSSCDRESTSYHIILLLLQRVHLLP